MTWDFNLDFSKPRQGPATPAFSGDWRGGAAGQQAPNPNGRAPAPVVPRAAVENESDEEAQAPDAEKPQVKLVWDATKGQLVPAKEGDTDGEAKLDAAEEKVDQAGPEDAEGEEEEAEEGDEEVDMEAESRNAFLAEASTPELIKQAVAVGGPLAESTKDKWVLDQATQLYFKYDSPRQKMFCWNTSQGCMYHWKERGRMSFLWASPGGAGTAPPSSVEPMVAAVVTEAPKTAVKTLEPKDGAPVADTSHVALWVTMIPPQVLAADFEDANAQAEEELELNAKAMGAVIGKGGKGIQEIQQATGVKATTINPREDAQGQRRFLLQGSKAQIMSAKSAIEQRVAVVLGVKMAEKVQKHWSSQLLEKKRTETGSEAAKSGVRGLSDFALQHSLKAVMARKLAKLDAQLQRYMIRHFQPMKAKPVNALRGYLTQLFKYPQRWRLEALYEDGELDGEICETIPLRGDGMVVGKCPAEQEEQVIEAEVNMSLGPKEASKIYGDVQDQHCRLHRMGNDFYVMALESQIGTLVDGQKIRHHDGPVPIRDGTTLGVGKYLFYCEVGSETFLQERRKKLLDGERFWKEGSVSLQMADTEAEAKLAEAADGEEEVEGEDPEGAEDEEAVDVLFTDGSMVEETEELQDKSQQNEEQLDSMTEKRKRDEDQEDSPEKKLKAEAVEDAPMPDAVLDEVEELAEVEAPA